jgi:hypothetical protein
MFAHLVSKYHLHPIVDHFTIALLTFGIAAEILAAAAILLSRDPVNLASVWGQKLRSTALLLMIGGAVASVLSYFTGDEEADRLWDTILKRTRLPLARDSRTSPDVRVPDSGGLASDAGVVETPRTRTNRLLDCGDRRGGRACLPR